MPAAPASSASATSRDVPGMHDERQMLRARLVADRLQDAGVEPFEQPAGKPGFENRLQPVDARRLQLAHELPRFVGRFRRAGDLGLERRADVRGKVLRVLRAVTAFGGEHRAGHEQLGAQQLAARDAIADRNRLVERVAGALDRRHAGVEVLGEGTRHGIRRPYSFGIGVNAAGRAEVDVDVDEPRQHGLAGRLDELRLERSGIGPLAFVDLGDLSAAHQDGAGFDHPAIADEDPAAANQERALTLDVAEQRLRARALFVVAHVVEPEDAQTGRARRRPTPWPPA